MAFGFHQIHSTKMNQRMLRVRGMQRVKHRDHFDHEMIRKAYANYKPNTPVAKFHDEMRMRRAVKRGIQREILAYLLTMTILTIVGLMAYGIFAS